jgi:hypothetical protein
LRLRASEIALGLLLKKEKEKSQRIIVDAESAVSLLFFTFSLHRTSAEKHGPAPYFLTHLRTSYLALLPVILSPMLDMKPLERV